MNEQQKLDALQRMTGLDVSALGAAKKDEAEEAGRESKEVEAEPEPQPAKTATPDPSGVGLTPELIGQALAMAIQPVLDRLDALEQKAQAEPELVDDFAILMDSYKSNVIGQPDARVDGRTKEAKDAPAERPSDGFPAGAKLNNDGFAARSVNRIFGGQLAKELAERQGGQ